MVANNICVRVVYPSEKPTDRKMQEIARNIILILQASGSEPKKKDKA